jgi:hypothetical protein
MKNSPATIRRFDPEEPGGKFRDMDPHFKIRPFLGVKRRLSPADKVL